jgi:hypothetical protein
MGRTWRDLQRFGDECDWKRFWQRSGQRVGQRLGQRVGQRLWQRCRLRVFGPVFGDECDWQRGFGVFFGRGDGCLFLRSGRWFGSFHFHLSC